MASNVLQTLSRKQHATTSHKNNETNDKVAFLMYTEKG